MESSKESYMGTQLEFNAEMTLQNAVQQDDSHTVPRHRQIPSTEPF